MQRRSFIKEASMYAVGIGVFGNLQWNNNRFIGDSPTTTDILGPFYRPGAPSRLDLNPPGFQGEILHLTGTIYKEDGNVMGTGSMIMYQTNMCTEQNRK